VSHAVSQTHLDLIFFGIPSERDAGIPSENQVEVRLRDSVRQQLLSAGQRTSATAISWPISTGIASFRKKLKDSKTVKTAADYSLRLFSIWQPTPV
jgi:hypothetical protein